MTTDRSSPRQTTAGGSLLAYLSAFSEKNAGAICSLFSSGSLAELPLLKPNRLFGREEIRAGHEAAFENIENAEFTATQPIADNGEAAIWVGRLRERRKHGDEHVYEVAIVCEAAAHEVRRLTVHLDGRGTRRWADHTIL